MQILPGSGSDDGHVGTSVSRWGAVLAFMLVYIVAFIDRQLLAIVVDPVKSELGIGDTQIGLLQGFMFTTVFMIAAVPMSYLVDHFNRTRVLLSCMLAWSLATLYCGFATTFTEFLIGRIGLAVAEAVVPMAAMSVIGDLFPRHKIGQAAAVFMNATYFGNGAAMLLGGWLTALLAPFQDAPFPIVGTFDVWRGLFIGAAGLSILIMVGLSLFLKEPPRRELQSARTQVDSGEFWKFFWANRRYVLSYCLFASCITLVGYSMFAWPATLLIRIHDMSPLQVGMIMGPMFILTSIPGTLLTAWLSSLCVPERALQHLMLVMVSFVILLGPLVVLMGLAPTSVAMFALAAVLLVYSAAHGAILTPLQLIAPNRMRGRLAAVSSFTFAIPAALGPVAIGLLTDRVFKDPMALGEAIALTLGAACTLGTLAGLLAWREAKRFEGTVPDEQPSAGWTETPAQSGVRADPAAP